MEVDAMRWMMVAVVVMLMSPEPTRAQETTEKTTEQRDIASLKGIPGVRVVVEDIAREARANGLTKAEIRSTVKDILASQDIPILTEAEWSATPSQPMLYIQTLTFKDDPLPHYIVSVRVQVLQKVALIKRAEDATTMAVTWEEGSTVVVGLGTIRDVVSRVIKPEVEQFAADYRVMNPT